MKENNNKKTRRNLIVSAVIVSAVIGSILLLLLALQSCEGCAGCGEEKKVDYVESTETEATFTGEEDTEVETETESESREETEIIEDTEATESTEDLDGPESGIKKPKSGIKKPSATDENTSEQPGSTEQPGSSEQPDGTEQPGNSEQPSGDEQPADTETEEKVLLKITASYDNTTPVPEGTTLGNIKPKVTVTATYKVGSTTTTAVVTGFTLRGNLVAGQNNVVTVSYTEKRVTKSTTITVTVSKKPEETKVLSEITASYDNTIPVPEGTNLDDIKSKVTVTATYKVGNTTTTAVVTGFTLSGNLVAGQNNVVTVSYTENGVTKSTTITVTVSKKPEETKVLSGITASYDNSTPVPAGTTLDYIKSRIVVTATYKVGSTTTTAVVADFTLSGNLTAGQNNVVTVSYTENGVTVTTTITVTVREVPKVVITIQNRNSVEGETIKNSDFDYAVSNADKIGFTIEKSDLHVTIVKEEGTAVGTYALTGTCLESSIWDITINPGTYTIIARQHNPGEGEDGTDSSVTPVPPEGGEDGTDSSVTPVPPEGEDETDSSTTPVIPEEGEDGTDPSTTPVIPEDGEDGEMVETVSLPEEETVETVFPPEEEEEEMVETVFIPEILSEEEED